MILQLLMIQYTSIPSLVTKGWAVLRICPPPHPQQDRRAHGHSDSKSNIPLLTSIWTSMLYGYGEAVKENN